MFANGLTEDQGQHNCKVFKEGFSDEKIARIDNSFDLASHYRNARLGWRTNTSP